MQHSISKAGADGMPPQQQLQGLRNLIAAPRAKSGMEHHCSKAQQTKSYARAAAGHMHVMILQLLHMVVTLNTGYHRVLQEISPQSKAIRDRHMMQSSGAATHLNVKQATHVFSELPSARATNPATARYKS